MGGACSPHGRYEKFIQNCGRNSEEKNHSDDLGVDEKIILK
jgi:hypothetical protein